MIAAYVLDINGSPLMPMHNFKKVRKLLKEKKAKVVSREPFVIRLLYEPKTHIEEDCVLGIDTGSKTIGASVFCNGEILYASEVEIRNDIKIKMDRRRMYRRDRRNRKTRYRKTRFLNRGNSTKKGRYSPTLKSKFDSHVREIEFIKSILPIKHLVLETGSFDTHKLKNPNVKGWGYQRGINYGYANARAHALDRDNYTCQICGAKNTRLEVHHIKYRSQGGSDDLENLITLCEDCHHNLHKGKIELKVKGKKKSSLKHATQMSVIRSMLLKEYPEAIETFGYITKQNRWTLGLDKTHYIDAAVISSEGKSIKFNCDLYLKRHIAKSEYKLAKGLRSERKINMGKIHGFRKWDKVLYMGTEYFIKARRTRGVFELENIYKEKIDFSYMPRGFKTVKVSNLIRLSARSTTLCIRTKIS